MQKGTITEFFVFKNAIKDKPGLKYINLRFDGVPFGGVRHEVWPIEAPDYAKGDNILLLYDPKATGFNESMPSRSTLHNIKIREHLKKYRPDLLKKINAGPSPN